MGAGTGGAALVRAATALTGVTTGAWVLRLEPHAPVRGMSVRRAKRRHRGSSIPGAPQQPSGTNRPRRSVVVSRPHGGGSVFFTRESESRSRNYGRVSLA